MRNTPYTDPIRHDAAQAECERDSWLAAKSKAARGPDCQPNDDDAKAMQAAVAAYSAWARRETAKAELTQIKAWIDADLGNYNVTLHRRDRFNEPETVVVLNHLIETQEQLLAFVNEALEDLG